MSDSSGINWTDATWNPVLGCARVSPGCDSCYAISQARIRAANPHPKIAAAFEGLTDRVDGRLDWTGRVNLLPERLAQPLSWRKPRKIFVNSLADLFHDDVPDAFIAEVFSVMARAQQHTFQVLTKRHGRMRSLLSRPSFRDNLAHWAPWPLPNVWLGVSAEDQHWAAIRVHALLATPASVRWVSAEPLLGPVDLRNLQVRPNTFIDALCGDVKTSGGEIYAACPGSVSWVVAGGESGAKARPAHPDWLRSLRDQCRATRVPFWMKQWGEWGPAPWRVDRETGESDDAYKARAEAACATHALPAWAHDYDMQPLTPGHKPWSPERTSLPAGQAPIRRWGRKATGRELDGETWAQFPRNGVPVTA